ncbi:MAG: thrombospondin type 3 repeat-containing protein [Campylobacterota bacterium]|nr:thrombospondin type 3 repeat-containing protein [Campylobacterota bacterium]
MLAQYLKLIILPILGITLLSGCATSSYDEDLDGVKNKKDLCLGTPQKAIVDKYGCALDNDKDGVIDLFDQCPNTPFIDLTNAKGCSIKN